MPTKTGRKKTKLVRVRILYQQKLFGTAWVEAILGEKEEDRLVAEEQAEYKKNPDSTIPCDKVT